MGKSSGYDEQGVGYSQQTTSKEAASTLKPEKARSAVMRALRVTAMADFEIHEYLKWPADKRVTPRRRELVNAGRVVATDKRAVNPVSGKSCIIWSRADEWAIKGNAERERILALEHKCPDCGCIF